MELKHAVQNAKGTLGLDGINTTETEKSEDASKLNRFTFQLV